MAKYTFGDLEQDIDPENEAAFEAAGWRPETPPVEPDKKKSDK